MKDSAKNKEVKNVWEVQYQNDVDGDENGDESFWEWWEVKGKDMTFKCDSPKEAQWLCDVLNERENSNNNKLTDVLEKELNTEC